MDFKEILLRTADAIGSQGQGRRKYAGLAVFLSQSFLLISNLTAGGLEAKLLDGGYSSRYSWYRGIRRFIFVCVCVYKKRKGPDLYVEKEAINILGRNIRRHVPICNHYNKWLKFRLPSLSYLLEAMPNH